MLPPRTRAGRAAAPLPPPPSQAEPRTPPPPQWRCLLSTDLCKLRSGIKLFHQHTRSSRKSLVCCELPAGLSPPLSGARSEPEPTQFQLNQQLACTKTKKGWEKKRRGSLFFFFLFPLRDHRSARADKPLAICDEQARGRLAAAPASTLGSAARHKIKPNQRPQRGPASKGIPLTEGSSYMKKNKNQIIPIKA